MKRYLYQKDYHTPPWAMEYEVESAIENRTMVYVTMFSEELDNVFATGTHKACEFNVAAGDITIYCPVNGLRFYKIEFQE